MDILGKLKETTFSVLPIVGVVLVLNFTIAPLGSSLVSFLIGSILLLVGLSIFLAGTDIGMEPVGQRLGAVLAGKKNIWLMMTVGFLVGFGVTYAEPDVSVLVSQVHSLNPAINENLLKLLIAVGLGAFVDVGLLRMLRNVKLKWVLIVSYGAVFVLMALAGQKMASISFDASGATTGPLAVPFMIALGLGVSASAKGGEDNSFGLTGIASIGPIIAVGLMAILAGEGSAAAETAAAAEEAGGFFGILLEMLKKTAMGFGPLAAIILILQFVLLKFPPVKFRNICLGILYSFVGIVIFLTGVEFGFSGVGRQLGSLIGSRYPSWVSVLVGLVFGAIVVVAEPAVWVLTKQVEEVSAGRIKRNSVLVFLCVGVSAAVALSVIRILFDINYLWFVFICVGLALAMTFFCPPLFTGIAFDSGGVASGPMSTTFLLSFTMGLSGSADMGFGLVGMIAMSPLIAIQVLGIIFRIKENKARKAGAISG